MRVVVDESICTGHGRCYALAPDLFGPDDYGHCEILASDGVVPDGLEAQARTGRDNCPEQAISIEE
jgi:ferredoxin